MHLSLLLETWADTKLCIVERRPVYSGHVLIPVIWPLRTPRTHEESQSSVKLRKRSSPGVEGAT